MIGRRKELPAELRAPYEAFHAVLDEIEPAKAGLADVARTSLVRYSPTASLSGRPGSRVLGRTSASPAFAGSISSSTAWNAS